MNFLNNIPPITKNLLFINVIMFLLQLTFPWVNENLALYFFKSPDFEPYQLLAHMFMHWDFQHLFFNMFALYMFGSAIEQRMGEKKFLIYYLFTGFGAVALHYLSQYIESYEFIQQVENYGSVNQLSKSEIAQLFKQGFGRTVGASGAVFGLLAAFALLYPNQELMLLFLPVPIKAKYFVLGYAAIELFSGISGAQDGIAHFAHLGGALFGFLLIKQWQKQGGL